MHEMIRIGQVRKGRVWAWYWACVLGMELKLSIGLDCKHIAIAKSR